MKYIDYKEKRRHGSFDFPFAFYHITPNSPRYQMLHHWHPEFELIHILKGSLLLQADGQEIRGMAGDSFLITGGVMHSGTPRNCHYECVVFDMDFFLKEHLPHYKELFSIACQSRILTDYYPRENSQANQIFIQILKALREKRPGYELIVQGCFYQFFGLALQHNLFLKTEKLPDHLQKIKLFKTVISMIQQHYAENITLNDIAASIHMNPNYFCRFFKEITHQTPVEYLNYYRIESACEKLSASDHSITEIAMACGFNDVSYFVKVFKKYKGITPTQYLKKAAF